MSTKNSSKKDTNNTTDKNSTKKMIMVPFPADVIETIEQHEFLKMTGLKRNAFIRWFVENNIDAICNNFKNA